MADQQSSISLPEEAVRAMQARVDAGEYPSLRELILDSVEEPDLSPLDPEYFGEDFETWISNNRELLLQESEAKEGMMTIEEARSWLEQERRKETSRA